MKVKLLHDTIVRFEAGAVVDVSEAEGKRLIAFGNGQQAEEPKAAKKAKK